VGQRNGSYPGCCPCRGEKILPRGGQPASARPINYHPRVFPLRKVARFGNFHVTFRHVSSRAPNRSPSVMYPEMENPGYDGLARLEKWVISRVLPPQGRKNIAQGGQPASARPLNYHPRVFPLRKVPRFGNFHVTFRHVSSRARNRSPSVMSPEKENPGYDGLAV